MSAILFYGKVAGLLGACLMLVQLLLISWGRNTKLHKINGKVAFLFIFVHATVMFYIYGLSVFQIDDVTKAFIALLLLVTVIFTSVILRNNLKYEVWYFIHLLTYFAILLAFGHQQTVFPLLWNSLYIFTFANVFYFKFLKLLLDFWKYKFKVNKVVKETENTISLYITGNNIENFSFEPGQYVVIRFLAKDLFWQAHPFSFSTMPGNKYLRLTIKNSGDFTSEISRIKIGTPVVLDGPHGEFTASQLKENKILLLAGGVGVTPLRGLIEQFNNLNKDIVMICPNKTKKDVIFQKELTKYNVTYVFKRLDKDTLIKLVPDIVTREVYICGPEGFNKSMKQYSQEFGVKSIHLEEFST